MANKVSPMETSSIQLPKGPQPLPTWKRRSTIFVLCFINLVNYIDRYTVSGVLTEVQQYYAIGDAWGGFIQTSFMITYMVFSPLFGYTGDRQAEKMTMRKNRNAFFQVQPQMADGNWRAKIYMIYYLAIPFGVGLGYMLAQGVSNWTNEWQWGVRAVGIGGVICFILAIFLIFEPDRDPRDMAGGDSSTKPTQNSETNDYTPQKELKTTSYLEDVKYLFTNPTNMLVTFAASAALFMSGNLAWWGPTLIKYAQAHEMKLNSTVYLPKEVNGRNSIIFGAILVIGGIFGVLLGSMISHFMVTGWKCFKYIKTRRAPAIVCSVSCFLAAPSLLGIILVIPDYLNISYAFIAATTVFLAFTWSLNVCITMAVVVPNRRSSANSWQMTISHLIGDAGGPHLLGWITDLFYHNSGVLEDHLYAYLKSFYLCVASLVIAGVLYAASALTILRDMRKMEEDTKLINMEDEGDNNKPKPAPSAPKIGSADRHLHKHSANEELLTDPKEDNKSFTSPVVSAYLGGASKEALDDTQIETSSSTEDGTKKLSTGLVPSNIENSKDGSDGARDPSVEQTHRSINSFRNYEKGNSAHVPTHPNALPPN
ncbi:hypothetical protein WR25_13166 [Diploscapter pachys]|uniref:Major facilitator superfamily (MFS) profile domain-containing protein n=1 Tax=Diploscapter pachys TaxID=2018661 RepID=A0A2A2LQ06_9BILA|nr:hypothetical protein WR25_13166 [Diploscapter pachys]